MFAAGLNTELTVQQYNKDAPAVLQRGPAGEFSAMKQQLIEIKLNEIKKDLLLLPHPQGCDSVWRRGKVQGERELEGRVGSCTLWAGPIV